MNHPSYAGILLCSGGLDSTTLAYWLAQQEIPFLPVFLRYGQHCADTEYQTLIQVLPHERFGDVVTLDISDIYRKSPSRLIAEANLWTEAVNADELYLPYRNLLFLAIAAAFAQSQAIPVVYAAFINSNHAKEIDCSATFFDQLESLLHEYGSVRVEMPFRNFTKTQVAGIGIDLGVPIANTFSCQVSSTVPCGVCPNCVDRLDALANISNLGL